jgi:hypothetical protein
MVGSKSSEMEHGRKDFRTQSTRLGENKNCIEAIQGWIQDNSDELCLDTLRERSTSWTQ